MHVSGTHVDPRDLPALSLSRPREAFAYASDVVASATDPGLLSYARQAIGIVLREDGMTAEAVTELRAGVRCAQAAGSQDRVADVRATLGATLIMHGRTTAGLRELDAAAQSASGQVLGTVLMRRAGILSQLGRYDEALTDMSSALRTIRKSRDALWEARALSHRGLIHLARGSVGRAESDIQRSVRLLVALGQELEAADAIQSQGQIAYARGDLPRSLALYDEAERRQRELASAPPELAFDRCRALMAAGLADEAVEVVDRALAERDIQPRSRAELLLSRAYASLAAGDAEHALDAARQARRLFRHQRRELWEARAQLATVRARRMAGERSRRLLSASTSVAEQLRQLRVEEAPQALLLAGQQALELDDPSAATLLTAAARYRRDESAIVRAAAWLARALASQASGSARGVFSACARGLQAIDEHRSSLGSSELRVLAATHGEALARLALETAADRGPRRLLIWSELCRATALDQPPVRPPTNSGATELLGNLRSQSRLRQQGKASSTAVHAVEQAIRHERHRLPGVWVPRETFDAQAFTESLGAHTFVELVDVSGDLMALVVHGGRVRRHVVGRYEHAVAELAKARFILRLAAHGRPHDLEAAGRRLEAALLGSAASSLGPGPVVFSPPSRLHATPWSLLPSLSDRPVSVVPSAQMWQRVQSAAAPTESKVVLIAGPGLQTGGAEVHTVARTLPHAVLLHDGDATVSASLRAMDGASLVHIAGHGQLRADSPMFSSIDLADGPLTVHDFELLGRAPHRLVLSACESGVMVPVGDNELLGLAAALLAMGTAGIVSSVVAVNDVATVDLMVDVHAALAAGAGLPEVLLSARQQAGRDGVSAATAAAFVAVGV